MCSAGCMLEALCSLLLLKGLTAEINLSVLAETAQVLFFQVHRFQVPETYLQQVGCHCLLQGIPEWVVKQRNLSLWEFTTCKWWQNGIMCVCVNCSDISHSLWPRGLKYNRLLCPWDSPGENTGVGSLSLLQGIFPSQGSNLCLLHCRQILYHLSH